MVGDVDDMCELAKRLLQIDGKKSNWLGWGIYYIIYMHKLFRNKEVEGPPDGGTETTLTEMPVFMVSFFFFTIEFYPTKWINVFIRLT